MMLFVGRVLTLCQLVLFALVPFRSAQCARPAHRPLCVSCLQMRPIESDSLGFLIVPSGIHISDWLPIDYDFDGTIEFAILSDHTPPRVGVFEPATFGWLDGPHFVDPDFEDWGVRYSDETESFEYYFLRKNALFKFNSSRGSVDSLWDFGYKPRSITIWGTDTHGAPVIAATGDSTHENSGNGKFLKVHELMTGVTLKTLIGGDSRPQLTEDCPKEGMHSMAVHYSRATFDNTPWVGRNDYYQYIYLVDREWNIARYVSLPGWRTLSGPPADLWEVRFYDIGRTTNPLARVISWLVESRQPRTMGEIQPMYGACALDADQEWSLAYWQRNLYAGMAISDWDRDGSAEVILPLGDSSGWQRRDVATGVILDVIQGLPPVAVHTYPLFSPVRSDLFYIAESSLYIYEPDIPSGISDDSDTQQVSADAFVASAHPNPFNSAVTLTWSGTASTLTIFNVLGQTVTEIPVGGRTSVTWDGCDSRDQESPSGIYIAQIASREFTASTKIVLLR